MGHMNNTTHHDLTAVNDAIATVEGLYPSFATLRPQLREDATVLQEGIFLGRLAEFTIRVFTARAEEVAELMTLPDTDPETLQSVRAIGQALGRLAHAINEVK